MAPRPPALAPAIDVDVDKDTRRDVAVLDVDFLANDGRRFGIVPFDDTLATTRRAGCSRKVSRSRQQGGPSKSAAAPGLVRAATPSAARMIFCIVGLRCA
jgi:hypothetical protein